MTQAANVAMFDRVQFTPRMLRDVSSGSTEVEFLGQRYAHPIIAAPFAYQSLLHPEGEVATAAGAAAQGALMTVSALSTRSFAEVRGAGENAEWCQLYWLGGREVMREMIARVEEAGFRAIVMTIDAPVQGVRDAEIRAGFSLPDGVGPVNLQGLLLTNPPDMDEGGSVIFDRLAPMAMNWDDLAWLCQETQLQVLVKGILHPEDAARAVAAGVDGIIVSNHGGRVLDGALPALHALAPVVRAVPENMPVFFDSGIRRGAHVFAALAVGARAVLVGQPIVAGLHVAGALGVSHVLKLMREELEVAMILNGCKTVQDIAQASVHLIE